MTVGAAAVSARGVPIVAGLGALDDRIALPALLQRGKNLGAEATATAGPHPTATSAPIQVPDEPTPVSEQGNGGGLALLMIVVATVTSVPRM